MRSSLLCLGVLMILSACSSGGGKGGGAAGNPAGVAKAQTLGQFTAEKESALEQYGGVPSGFELAPGIKCGDKETFDSRLRAGDLFKEAHASASAKTSSSSTHSSIVRSADATHLSESMTISDIAAVPAVNGMPAQVQIEASCAITTDKQEPFKCDIKYVNWQPPTDQSGPKDEACETDFQSGRQEESTGTVALGTFGLASGETVRAQSVHRVSTNVDIKCGSNHDDMKLVGTGSITTDEVVTFDLVTREGSMCTPTTTVVRKTVYQLDDGTVVSASSDEVLQAPKR